jgi:hypothetical protein
MANDDGNEPKIISDEGWKQQAQREKDKLEHEPARAKSAGATGKGQASARGGRPGPMPPASFLTLVNSLLIQALFCLGRVG